MTQTTEGYQITPQQLCFWEQHQNRVYQVNQCLVSVAKSMDQNHLAARFKQVLAPHDSFRSRLFLPTGLKQPLSRIEGDLNLVVTHSAEPLPWPWWQRSDCEENQAFQLVFWPKDQSEYWLQIICPAHFADFQSVLSLISQAFEPVNHPPPEDGYVQYLNYAEWLNDLGGSDINAEGHAFWRDTLKPNIAQQPARPQATDPCRKRCISAMPSVSLRPNEMPASIEQIAQACFAILLNRHANSEAIGIHVSGRSFEELAAAVGPFAKYLPMVPTYRGEQGFAHWLAEWQDAHNTAVNWQDFYAASSSADAVPYRSCPWTNLPSGEQFRVVDRFCTHPQTELQLNIDQQNDRFVWDYHRSSYDEQTMAYLIEGFQTLLEKAITHPETALGDLPILGPTEKHMLLNGSYEPLDFQTDIQTQPIHQRFLEHVRLTPHKTALEADGEQISYADLARQSAVIAGLIQAQLSGDEAIVGLCLPRGSHLTVAILAAMRANTTYLVLDPNWPESRHKALIEDAGGKLILTNQSLHTSLAAWHPSVVAIDTDSLDAGQPFTPLPSPQKTAPVYLIYTSGSTGKPKAVAIGHRQISHYTQGLIQRLGLHSDLRFGLISSLAADLGYTAFWPPLALGATLAVIPERATLDATNYQQYLSDHPVDVLKITPSHLKVLLPNDSWQKALPSTILILGGETSDPEWVDHLQKAKPAMKIVNHYGPTEATIGVLAHTYISNYDFPLGKPLPGTRVYLLDERRQLLPVGAPGEIYISGPSLADGYVNECKQTQARFIANPFASQPFGLLYRTGDLAQYRPDGQLQFLGRADFQVKIRGFRVELGEIEATLAQHSDINHVVVLAQAQPPEAPLQLHAFYTAETKLPPAQLRTWLLEQLPEYMVPATFSQLVHMPLTINGKIDRQHLHTIIASDTSSNTNTRLPETSLQQVLAKIWCDILAITGELPDIHTPFFQLGGHSLLLIMVSTRIQKIFGLHLGIDQLFQANTLASMSLLIEENRPQATTRADALLAMLDRIQATSSRTADEGESPLVNTDKPPLQIPDAAIAALQDQPPVSNRESPEQLIQPHPNLDVAPLSFEQQRLWFLYCYEGGSATYNNPATFRVKGQVDVQALATSFGQIEARHSILRTQFHNQDGQAIQEIQAARPTPLDFCDISHFSQTWQEQHIAQLMDHQVQTPFALDRKMPWRAQLVRLAPERHLLLYTIHHICSDGWSMRLFVKELFENYRCLTQGQPLSNQPLAIQYADYARWQQEHFNQASMQETREFWRNYLKGADLQPFLPYDHLPSANQASQGAIQKIRIDKPSADALRKLAMDQGTTLFAILLTAYALLMRFFSKKDDLVIGTDVANRQQKETEELIGFFVNQLAIRLRFDDNPPLDQVLHDTQQNLSTLLKHQSFPFSEVVNALGLARDLDYSPVFQTKFFLEHKQAPPPPLPQLAMERVQALTFSARLDLTLGLWNNPDGEITGWFNFNRNLFHQTSMQKMAETFSHILARLCASPHTQLNTLMLSLLETNPSQSPSLRAKRDPSPRKTRRRRRATVTIQSSQQLVNQAAVFTDKLGPWRIQPAQPGVDLASWIGANRHQLETQLAKSGTIVFDGFAIKQLDQFEAVASSLIDNIFKENSEHQPVSKNGAIQTPVDYAADQHLLWHNENTFNYLWPSKILFGCAIAAEQGGETPIVDSRTLYQCLPKAIRREFQEKGVQYVRTYSAELGLSWQQVFKTTSREQVEQKCREGYLEFRWLDDGRLQTKATRPAVIIHPKTGEMSWLNQAQHWHFSCLQADTQASIAKLFRPDEYPRHCFFGDGSPIPDESMAIICQCYRDLEVTMAWKQGNLVLLDNAITAHARNPYQGARRLWVCMGDLVSFADHPHQLKYEGQ